jgi:hypothetical protein
MYAVGLNQVFDMFAPDPHSVDGWFVVAGTLADGRVVDMMTGESVSFEKPRSVSESYGSMLWMSQLISFWYPGPSDPAASARYLARAWNRHHSASEQVRTIEIHMMSYETGAHGAHTAVVRTSVWSEAVGWAAGRRRE